MAKDHDGFHPFHGHVSKRLSGGGQLSRMAPDEQVLSYHDVCLTKEDIDTLRGDWLTDNVISFHEEYLEHELLTHHKDAHVVLLRPSMTLMLAVTPDPATLKDALPSFKGVSHVFLPINDNTDVEHAEGGSHWSLLVISLYDRTAFHYDSLSSANRREAAGVTRKMGQLLKVQLKFADLEDAPQQQNSSDCGVFVCMVMAELLSKLLAQKKSQQVSMSLRSKHLDASAGRKEMYKIIEAFRREGEARRSASGSPLAHGQSKSRSPPRIE